MKPCFIKNIKITIGIIIGIVITILILNPISKENFTSVSSVNSVSGGESIKKVETISYTDKFTMKSIKSDYDLNDIAIDIIDKNPNQKIDWKSVYIDNKNNANKNTLKVIPKPITDEIVSLSSSNNFLESPFREDVCEKYIGDYDTIQKKCEQLSVESCKIPACCVLLNGSKCVAGNINGPIFLTEDGKNIDYKYFYNKNECYGDCGVPSSYDIACSEYNNNSTNVSKQCMIEMFNKYGCPNKNPVEIINDEMVTNYKDITKEYVENFIKESAYILLNKTDLPNIKLCKGK